MNEVFVMGKIKNIDFEFMYESKNISICVIELELRNGSNIKVNSYDEIADAMIQNYKIGDFMFCHGRLNSNGVIDVEEVS